MRLFIFIFLFNFGFKGLAQKQIDNLQITYQLYSNGERPNTYPAILHVKDNITIYEMKIGLSESWDGQFKSKATSFTISERLKKDSYLKINHNTKELLDFAPMPGSLGSLVKDNYPVIKWTVTKETKSILNYNCTKATATYRGRDWIAWFAPEIALPYGPWKLHGLPGLILEIQSADTKYTMQALKIENTKSDIFDKDFKTLKPVYNKQPITYQQHLKNEDEAFENMVAKLRSDGMDVTAEKALPNGYELKYEWED